MPFVGGSHLCNILGFWCTCILLLLILGVKPVQFIVKEYPTEYMDSVFTDPGLIYTYKPKSIRFRNISKSTHQNLTKFSGFFGGHRTTSNPSKFRDLAKGF